MEEFGQFLNFKNYKYYLVCFFILLIWGSLIYSNSFFGEFVLDDENVLNPWILTLFKDPLKYLAFKSQRVVADLTFAIQYKIHGESVFGYHLINFFIHIFNSFLVLGITKKLLKIIYPTKSSSLINQLTNALSLIPALIFLSHPIQTMAVSYITQRYESLASMFYHLAIWIFLIYRSKSRNVGSLTSYSLLLTTLFLIGMFTKVTMATLPLILFVIEWLIFGKGKLPIKILISLIPGAILIFLLGGYMYSFKFLFATFENTNKELVSPFWYLLTQFRVFLLYIFQIILPFRLNADHHLLLSTSVLDIRIWIGVFVWISAGILVWINRIKNPLISLGLAWFLITPLPSSSIIPILDVANEYRMYLPMAGVSLLILGVSTWFLDNRKLNDSDFKSFLPYYLLLSTFYIFILGILTFNRNFVYNNSLNFWEDVVKKSPQKARGHLNYGTELHSRGKIYEAALSYKKTLDLQPNHEIALANLGTIFVQAGDFEIATNYFTQALTINPNNKDAYNGLGVIYLNTGELDKAEEMFLKVQKLDPDFMTLKENLEILNQKKLIKKK